MFNNIFNKLQHIEREPVPEHLWSTIQQTIEYRRMDVVPGWMKVAATIITLIVMAEMITSIKKTDNTSTPFNSTYSFYQNNQWYND